MQPARRLRRLVTGSLAAVTSVVLALGASALGPTSAPRAVGALVAARVVNVGVPRDLAHAATRPERPVVTRPPRDAHVSAGASATFVARASGRPAPRIQWYWAPPGSTRFAALRGATSPSLTLTHVTTGMDRRRYRAIFANVVGRTTSRAVTLFVTPATVTPLPTTTTTVAPIATTTTTVSPVLTPTSPPTPISLPPTTPSSAPVVTLTPQNATVTAGSTVSFSAAASGAPTPSVAWWYATGAGGPFIPYPGATSGVLAFATTRAENGWLFEAVFTNVAGSVTTSAATLVVALANSNWAGYVTTQDTYSAATGTFTVPSAICPSGATTYSSVWVGIDGFGSSTVEQDGVEVDCSNGVPYYVAWYEMYGDLSPQCNCNAAVPLSTLNYPVRPGDVVTAHVNYDTISAQWDLSLADVTQGWTFFITIAAPSPPPAQSSAEWILEQPLLCSDASCTSGTPANLTPTSPFTFSAASATASGGTGTISGFAHAAIAIATGATIVKAPGVLSADGSSFAQ